MACVRRVPLLVAVLAFVVLATGCEFKKPVLPAAVSTAQEAQADAAWRRGDFAQSEQLYREILLSGQVPSHRQDMAWERLIQSALKSGHGSAALEDLKRWAQHRPEAKAGWGFHQAHLQTFMAIDQPGFAKRHLMAALSDTTLPRETRVASGRALAGLHWEHKELADAFRVLESTYPLCSAASCRLEMERELLARLSALDPRMLAMLDAIETTPESRLRFPALQLGWKRDMALLGEHPERWASLHGSMAQRLEEGRWEDDQAVRQALADLESRLGTPREVGIALLIPLSGPYAPIGWKILSGAEMARQQLEKSGAELNIKALNSESDGWAEQIRNLPEGYSFVGGPVLPGTLQEAVRLGVTQVRPFFAFTPTFNEIREGTQAWRFFGSPDDQVRSLLRWTTGQLGVSSYAVLYPDERFGLGMSRFFWEQAVQMGGKVTALKSYPPRESKAWAKTVESVLVPQSGRPGAVRPDPDFEAVFIPDTLTNARIIVPQFHFFDETRLLFLGTELWTQGWGEESSADAGYFQLALMPGAWWTENPAPGAQQLRKLSAERGETPDFWVALGYDFTLFASTLGPLPGDWAPREINRLLAQGPELPWSLAPMQWDLGGRMTQDMFVLTPGGKGLVLADPQRMKSALDEAARRHKERRDAGRSAQQPRNTTVQEQDAD
jgi:uncharacterized protein